MENTNETIEKTPEELKAENEALTKRIGQAEHVIETLKKGKAEKPPEPTEPPAEAPRQEIDVEAIEQRVTSKLREELLSDAVDTSLASVSDDPAEREEILREYKTSIVKSGVSRASIEADMRKAAALVRSQRNEKLAAETAAAARSGATTTSAGGSGAPSRPTKDDGWKKHLSATDLKYMTDNNWPEEKMKKAALAVAAK